MIFTAESWVNLLNLIGRTLLHSLWEATVVAVALFVVLTLLGRASAQTRYLVALSAFACCALLPLGTAFVLAERSAAPSPQVKQQAASASNSASLMAQPTPFGTNATAQVGGPNETAHALDIGKRSNPQKTITNLVATAGLHWVVLAWLAGLLIQSARVITSLVALRRLGREHSIQAPTFLVESVRRLQERLAVGVAITTRVSNLVDVPMIVGHLKPVLLVPMSALSGLPRSQLEMLLAHEVAHLRNLDHLINLLQVAIETVLFYNPAVIWVSRIVRHERECHCDEIAVRLSGGDRYTYSQALLSLEHQRVQSAAALAGNGGSLVQRIRRLSGLTPNRRLLQPVHWLIGVFLVAVPMLAVSMASAQEYGGTLRVAYSSIQQLDPYKSANNDEINAFSLVFDPLFIIGKDDFQPVPHLAESWEAIDDTTWVFHLREGVTFQDDNAVFPAGEGREVTADDVVYSINRFMDVSTAFALNTVESVTAIDRYTVEVKTKGPDPFLVTDPNRLTRAVIVPHEAVEQLGEEGFARQPIGSGPFKLTTFTPDQKLEFVRNDDYWLPVYLDAVEFVFIPDPTVQTIALESGDIDVITYLLNIDSVAQLADTPGVVLTERGGSYRGLGFNVTTAPFDEFAVRDALSKAINIDGAVNAVVAPFGQRAYGQVPPWVEFTVDESLKDLWEYNPEAALQELADAGFVDSNGDGILDRDGVPLSFNLKTSAGSQVRVLTIIVTQLKELGIDANILQQDTAVWADDLVAGNTGMFFDYSFAGTTGLYSMFHSETIGMSNTHYYSNPEVDAVLDEANRTIDFEARNALWHEAQRLIMQDRAVIPLYFEGGYSVTSSKVHDFVPPWGGLRLVSVENNVYID